MKMQFKKLAGLVLICAMVLSCFAACGAKKEDDTLVIAMPEDIGTGDAHNYSTQFCIQDWMYETLVKWEDNQIKPGLAESWEISDDGTEYTFHLRQGVKFTDGSSWDARIAKKNVDAVLLHQEDHSWLEALNQIKSCDIVDDNTIKITLKGSYYPFLQEMSLARPMSFIAEAAFPDSGDTYVDPVKEPIGTGKLKLIERKRGEYALFQRNDDYWGGPIDFEYVRVEIIPDANTQVAAMKSGEIDMIFDLGGTLTADAFQELKNSNFNTAISEPVNSLVIALNSNRGATADVNVRKAMEYAVNKDMIADEVFDGLRIKADYLFDPELPYCDVDAFVYDYNPQKAIELLEESGWKLEEGQRFRSKDGQPLTVEFYYLGTDNVSRTMGEVMQRMYEEVGIEMKLLGEDLDSVELRKKDGTFNMITEETWGGQYDPHSVVASYREPSHSHYRAQEGMTNKAELDQWVNELLVETNEEKRQDYYDKIINALTDQAIYIPVCNNRILAAAQTDIEGITFNSPYFIPLSSLHRVK